ncbi:hypothetical protein F5Y19DRAFT_38786 [Xylariaceae sp. FL1651]|nr:hypothetical protein F5Y19DRAFT_38786 [Xylariaceae sp. FL1651]
MPISIDIGWKSSSSRKNASMNCNIPGYYYDSEKGRYFKVENSRTAPTSANWSSDNVKRRKLREEDNAVTLRYLNLAKSRIKRARVLNEPLTGGFFAREYGAMKSDMQTACFAEGLRHKGYVSLSPLPTEREGLGQQIKHMYVDGQDYRTGMCTVYATFDENMLLSGYIPRDKNNRLNQRLLANYRIPDWGRPLPYEEVMVSQISDIQYHAPSNQMLFTSRQPGANHNSLWKFSPQISDDNSDPLCPRWILPAPLFQNLPVASVDRRDNDYEGHCVAPAPADSPLVCAVGTNLGIVQWERGADFPAWMTPRPASLQPHPRTGQSLGCLQTDLFRDIFAVDFQPGQSAVLRFGGRPGALFTADTRVPWAAWPHLRLPSAITHLRCLGADQVLVAGLRNHLAVYDMRFVRSSREDRDGRSEGKSNNSNNNNNSRAQQSRGGRERHNNHQGKEQGWRRDKSSRRERDADVARPVVRFEHYRNNAHIDIGFAYDASTGLVAAAHDEVPGTVALYSARTGARLRVLDFAPLPAGRAGADRSYDYDGAAAQTPERMRVPVVRSLQFQTFPRDHTPTLFVGAGPPGGITAFSFGAEDLEDEA